MLICTKRVSTVKKYLLCIFLFVAASSYSEEEPYLKEPFLIEPSLNVALEAPAVELAQSYLWLKVLGEWFELSGKETLPLEGDIDEYRRKEEYRRKHEKWLPIYSEAIEKRGYKTISGTYKGEYTESCERIYYPKGGMAITSFLFSLQPEVQRSELIGIEIMQQGKDAMVDYIFEEELAWLLEYPVVVVESAISIFDWVHPLAFDSIELSFFFRGEIKNQKIIVKPDLSVLERWPAGYDIPGRHDLINCTVTFVPL